MTFDINNTAHLQSLKDEVTLDPLSIGYNINGNTADILSLLNNPASNLSGATHNRVVEDLTVLDIANVIDSTEFTALDEYSKEWIKMFINQDKDLTVIDFKSKFLELFGAGSTTRTAANALLTIPVSRADELFGYTKQITKADWVKARDYNA